MRAEFVAPTKKACKLARKFFSKAEITVKEIDCQGEVYVRVLVVSDKEPAEAARVYSEMMLESLSVLSDEDCEKVSFVIG